MLHIVVCDDEAAFAENLTWKIEALPAFSPRNMRVCCLTDPEALSAQPCDLLFLDIDLGAINGIDVARAPRPTHPDTVLIFVTNYKEYAPRRVRGQRLPLPGQGGAGRQTGRLL